MKELSTVEAKTEMIKILIYLDDICKKNSINYTLIGGSLIGAIRHKGYIPWDDDIDVGLLKDDYFKLLEILENSNEYLLLSLKSPGYYSTHVKLVSTRTRLIEKDFEEIDNMGVFIDIFCYSYLPNNFLLRRILYYNRIFQNKLVEGLRKPLKRENFYILRCIRHKISKKIGQKRLYKSINNSFNYCKNTNYLISDFPQYGYKKEIKNSKDFNEFIKVPFENIEVSIIKEYDDFLRGSFGDYMKLPPLEKRINHELKAYWKENI